MGGVYAEWEGLGCVGGVLGECVKSKILVNKDRATG